MPDPETEPTPKTEPIAEKESIAETVSTRETVPVTTAESSTDPTGQVFVPADDAPPESLEDGETARPSTLKTATLISARVVIGIVTLAVIGAVIAAAILVPTPSSRTHPVSRVVTPTAATQQVVCPGGLLRLGSSTGAHATTASSLGSARVTSAALAGPVTASDFAKTDAGTAGTSAAPRLLSTPAAPAGSAPAKLSGAQSQQISTSEFVGLASAACTAPTADAWLAGGSTSVGRTTLVLLADPSAVAATVSIEVFGEGGQITAPGMDGILVAPGSQRVLSLAGFAPNVVSPVVHVTSTGGQVSASLEQTTVRGLVPGGVDFVGGASKPTTTTVIPGVVISATSTLQSELGQSGFDDLQTTLRLFPPGTKDATASITVLAEDGTATGRPTTSKVPAGRVTDLPLDSLSDGNYTIVVTSKVPLLASVRVSTASSDVTSPSTDFAWTTAAPLLTSGAMVSVISHVTPLLHLENPSAGSETVRVHALDGATRSVTVAARSATSVSVSPGMTYELTGFSQLYASVSGTDDGGVTSYVVSPPQRTNASVRVYG